MAATRSLPANPSLKSLKNQAKQVLHGHQSGAKDACERIRASHPRMSAVAVEEVREAPFALADALLVIAREYGYESWPKLMSEEFSTPEHFASEPGWEWAVAPDIWRRLGSSGSTGSEHCQIAYENQRENRALYVCVAIDDHLIERDPRAIGFDDEANRHVLRQTGSTTSKRLGLFAFALPYDEVPHGTITYIGIEVKES